jgi:hypothetical protein
MTFDPLTGGRHHEPPVTSGDWRADHRASIARAESERLERKQQELVEQTSERNTPAERIRIWERRHGLTLPRDANHPILTVVATATHLALHQVSEEQRRRSAGGKTEAAVAPPIV